MYEHVKKHVRGPEDTQFLLLTLNLFSDWTWILGFLQLNTQDGRRTRTTLDHVPTQTFTGEKVNKIDKGRIR